MRYSNINKKYWFAAAIISIIAIFILYPYSTYQGLKMEISRKDAIEKARSFLIKQNIDLTGYYNEGTANPNSVQMKHFQQNLSNSKLKSIIENEKIPTYGWEVLFYKNLPKDIPQTTYHVILSHSGKVFSYFRDIPNNASLPSLSKAAATRFITEYIEKFTSLKINEFKLVESNEANLIKRNDFTFRWEKYTNEVAGKLVLQAKVQGNQAGSFHYYFEVPEDGRTSIDASTAMLATVSIIFIFFLAQFAIYLFLKKYHQGEVWISMGRNLFIIFFLVNLVNVFNSLPGIGKGVQIGSLSYLFVKITMMLTTGLILFFFLSILIFTAWSVGESYTRSLWPEKLKAIDSVIKGHLLSLSSGDSLFRGWTIGFIIAFISLVSIILVNNGNHVTYFNTSAEFEIYSVYFPFLEIVSGSFLFSALSAVVITFFVITYTYQQWKKKWLSIFISGLVMMLAFSISVSVIDTNIFLVDMVIRFLYGCFFAYLFFAFDILTVFSVQFHASLLMGVFMLYPSSAPFNRINFYLTLLALIIVPVLYILSRLRKEEFVLENYGMPSHIQRISERERLRKELEIAAKVQLSLLPKEQPLIQGYDIQGCSIPAKEAGGDYYDFVKLAEGKTGIAIGDVSGKGVGAAIYMTLTKGIFQAHAEENASPKQVLSKVNHLLYKTIEKNSFVSMIYTILDPVRNEMIYSRAGQNPGIFCSNEDGCTTFLSTKGIALGLESGSIFDSVLHEEVISIKPGDVLVFYTDGFTEAMNERHEEYGEERLTTLIQQHRDKSSTELLNIILKNVRKFVDAYPQHDDMTIVIVKKK